MFVFPLLYTEVLQISLQYNYIFSTTTIDPGGVAMIPFNFSFLLQQNEINDTSLEV